MNSDSTTVSDILSLPTPLARLRAFVARERGYLEGLGTGITWHAPRWDVDNWLCERGRKNALLFTTRPSGVPVGTPAPTQKLPLPEEFSDFCKAVAVYLQRTRNLGHEAVSVYVQDCRRLYNSIYQRAEISPTGIIGWDFEEAIRHLQESNNSGIYDSATRLQAISEVIDRFRIASIPLQFTHSVKPRNKYLRYISLTDPERDEKLRRDDEKLPSKEALNAFALCTNNPFGDAEEILLRTIDLLIAMGQRANEITCIPLDCWVEENIVNGAGGVELDAHGEALVQFGIRYYPEKKFEPRIHWFSDQDVPLARRAVERLKLLTAPARDVARWQEANPGRLWSLASDSDIDEDELLKFLSFTNHRNLYLYLKNSLGILPSKEKRGDGPRRVRYYRAGEIENALLPKLGDHAVLKKNILGTKKAILSTSETLSIRFDGAFRFVRAANVIHVFPRAVTVVEINGALGADPTRQSIFDRRNLFEADGSRIQLTSHQPRHWRNTLYDLAGMSNVQQALALGRKQLDQNIAYQHTNLRERTQSHHDYLEFGSAREKMVFMHNGIRTKAIAGSLTDTYHHLRQNKGIEPAEKFLRTHSQAMHITPYGACGHDFSQTPCPNHIQCWNNCSHLHRTGSTQEDAHLVQQIKAQEEILDRMKEDGEGDFGSVIWIKDLEKKLTNMKRALDLKPKDAPVKVFPDGISIGGGNSYNKGSSVDETE